MTPLLYPTLDSDTWSLGGDVEPAGWGWSTGTPRRGLHLSTPPVPSPVLTTPTQGFRVLTSETFFLLFRVSPQDRPPNPTTPSQAAEVQVVLSLPEKIPTTRTSAFTWGRG